MKISVLKTGRVSVLLLAIAAASGIAAAAQEQNESGGMDAGTCVLKEHVYSCDGAKFHQALMRAETVAIQVHNSDGVARVQLTDLITKTLNKSVAQPGTQADLVFLITPVDNTGVINGAVSNDLGTLRIYSSTPEGRPQHLLWAETYRGLPDLPWPAVVNRLISQFDKHFQIR